MSANPDSVGNQGEFHSSIPPAKPATTSGHQLGQQVGNEAVPEFRTKQFPPGTAPGEHSHKPNPIHETPGQALNPDMDPSSRSGPLDMPGATSQDVYNANTFARPMEGQTSRELHGAHAGKRKKERNGLEGVGATNSDETVEAKVRQIGADLPEGVERGMKGKSGRAEGGYNEPGADRSWPEPAERVADERR